MRFSLSPILQSEGETILPLAIAKAHLRVWEDDEDDLIVALRDAAIDAVQQFTGKSLSAVPHEWRGRFDDAVRLGVGPVTEIASASYIDANGTSQTLSPQNDIRIGLDNEIEPAVGAVWPSTAEGGAPVTILFTAGYSADNRPPALLAAVKLLLGNLFLNREAVVTGTIATDLPFGFVTLCSPYRQIRI
jgi:uncharacterized phiE125 gp8 family phage protein